MVKRSSVVLFLVAPGLAVYLLALGLIPAEARNTGRQEGIRSGTETASGTDESGEIEAFTEPYQDIAIAAAEMGTLARVNVQEGDQVKVGEVLAGLDDQVLRAAQDVARYSMQVQGPLKSTQADLRMKEEDLQKLESLRDRNHASQREVDQVRMELEIAQARVQAVREELEIKSLEYRRIEAQLDQRLVRSPINGVVTEILKDAGEFVSPSDPVVIRVVQLDPLLAVFSVPLSQRQAIARDQRVSLRIGDSSQIVDGIVEYVSPTADASNTSVRVKVRLPNASGTWQSGQRTVLLLNHGSTADEAGVSPVAVRDR